MLPSLADMAGCEVVGWPAAAWRLTTTRDIMVSMRALGSLFFSLSGVILTVFLSLERCRNGSSEESDEGQECELHLGWACWMSAGDGLITSCNEWVFVDEDENRQRKTVLGLDSNSAVGQRGGGEAQGRGGRAKEKVVFVCCPGGHEMPRHVTSSKHSISDSG
ncbi:hypothetical protein F5883DRAFT_160937 [Diaporthe sp. PMI_573]|nr:hypothetical protein F5883DRAFT_160937 [Diaporthaceae sp. PMI_573]